MRLVLFAVLILVLAPLAWRLVPPAFRPWAPLDINAPATPVTRLKLWFLRFDNALCQDALKTSPFPADPVPDMPPHGVGGKPGPGGCSLVDAVRVHAGRVDLSPSSFLASCPLAVEWAMFVVHVVQPTAAGIYGRPVTLVHHLGSYNCRDIANTDEISAHATANALDVASFQIKDGPDVSVTDWDGQGKKGQFLHELRNGACRYFGVVLSPAFNRAHANHFHLQATGFGFCD